MNEALDAFITRLAATAPLEAASVILGIAYSVLAVRRSRWCWVSGGLSSAILVYLFARARLPMQSALQLFYVLMSAYGFRSWVRHEQDKDSVVTTWPVRAHLAAWLAIVALSAVSSRWLAAETGAAWPFLDSMTTWASLVATWLVVRMKLENWLYWIAIDLVLTYLCSVQKLPFVGLLFATYLVISTVGFATWLKSYRLQARAR
jgi:nicotinamide mononucleotide transporter